MHGLRGDGRVVEFDAGGAQGVVDGVEDGGGSPDGAALAGALRAGLGERGGRLQVVDQYVGDLVGGGHLVVHEAGRRRFALVVVGHLLEQRAGDALRDAAPALSLDDLRVDGDSAVLHAHVPQDLHPSGAFVQFDDDAVGGVGEGAVVEDVEGGGGRQTRFDVLGQQVRLKVGDVRDLLVGEGVGGLVPATGDTVRQLHVVRVDVPAGSRDGAQLVAELRRGEAYGAAADGDGAAGEGAEAVGDAIGVALMD